MLPSPSPTPELFPHPPNCLPLRISPPLHLPSLGHQVFIGLAKSSPTETRQGSQSSATYVPGASDQPMYAAWLVAQSLGAPRVLG